MNVTVGDPIVVSIGSLFLIRFEQREVNMNNVHDIDISLFRTFIVVAKTGNLTAAAILFEKTTSAIHYQIQRLEAAVGYDLFIRHKRKLKLSKAGSLLFPKARTLLNHYDRVMNNEQLSSASEQQKAARKDLSLNGSPAD